MHHNLRVHVSERKIPRDAMKIPCTATEAWGGQLNKRNWSDIYDTGPKLIQKAHINYMSRWFRFTWHQFLWLHLSLKAPRAGGERTGLTSGRLCTSKPVTARSGRLAQDSPIQSWPWKTVIKKNGPCGQSFGQYTCYPFVWRKGEAKRYLERYLLGYHSRRLEKNTSGKLMTWWSMEEVCGWILSFFFHKTTNYLMGFPFCWCSVKLIFIGV